MTQLSASNEQPTESTDADLEALAVPEDPMTTMEDMPLPVEVVSSPPPDTDVKIEEAPYRPKYTRKLGHGTREEEHLVDFEQMVRILCCRLVYTSFFTFAY